MLYSRTFPLKRLGQLRAAGYPAIFRMLLILANSCTINEMARILGKKPFDLYWQLGVLKEMQMIEVKAPYPRRPLHTWAGYGATSQYGSRLVGRQTRPLRIAA